MQSTSQSPRICVVMPTYNNARTIGRVIDDVRRFCADIIVVNDGSTDGTASLLEGTPGITLIAYRRNRGKGHALKLGLRRAADMGFDYAISIDSDGQHFADDIPVFVDAIGRHPGSLLIGARNLEAQGMPGGNTFANRFSNFWFKVETGITLADTQSGYRLYPLHRLRGMKFFTPRYEFEVEVIVRMAWRGVRVANVPVKVVYPADRVSHFRPLRDFTRISILNTFLVLAALLTYYPLCLVRALRPDNVRRWVRRHTVDSTESNLRLAAAMGFGVFMGIVPIWGYQMIAAVALAHLLRLNKAMVLLFSNVSIPPMIPLIVYGSLCTGSLIVGGARPAFSPDSLTPEGVGTGVLQYVAGSVALAALSAVAVTLASWLLLAVFRRRR